MAVSNQIPVVGMTLVDLSRAGGIGSSTALGPENNGSDLTVFTPQLPMQYGSGEMSAQASREGERFQGDQSGFGVLGSSG